MYCFKSVGDWLEEVGHCHMAVLKCLLEQSQVRTGEG